ncbi:HAD family phosphatase [Homoserinibacter sp. GY 40078]|uniref:HAD family hydrolase n=1 Tax=Homoserinibacter sp. GY 40078 TaxID=2603275 RepID=UPI0011CBDC09|nr:HAD-IB family hydrolase [Homoserinibacter sp. GY 40078]TXK18600.1 HAD-IB family hydrolase [Homoserinibacter sp. GY 40078]
MPEEHPATPSERPVVAFFDVDNTLMRGTSVFHVGREAWSHGIIGWRDIALFAWHQRRFIKVGENHEHMGSARERALGLVAGHTENQIRALAENIWDHRIKPRLWPETVALAHEHIAKGHQVWVVSATPVEVGELIARKLGLTGALGTRVEAVDGVYTGRLVGSVLHAEHKAVAARELAESIGADLAASWAYSDSRNDIPLLELVGNRVAVNPDAGLARYAAEKGWPTMRLDHASIKAQQKRVRREAKPVGRGRRD